MTVVVRLSGEICSYSGTVYGFQKQITKLSDTDTGRHRGGFLLIRAKGVDGNASHDQVDEGEEGYQSVALWEKACYVHR